MLILVTNDDGYDAPGLWVAYDLAYKLAGKDGNVVVVAPSYEQSGVGHAMSYTSPIAYHQKRENHFTVDGTPTDCILLAEELIGQKPDLVISGVNRGHNLGPDLLYSGTVGAAIEATANGIPAIALSQYYNATHTPEAMFDTAREFGLKAIVPIWKKYQNSWPMGRFLNINFPACTKEEVKGVVMCQAEPLIKSNVVAHRQKAPNARHYFWLGHPGPIEVRVENSDVAFVKNNYVPVSFCKLDLNDFELNLELSQIFEDDK